METGDSLAGDKLVVGEAEDVFSTAETSNRPLVLTGLISESSSLMLLVKLAQPSALGANGEPKGFSKGADVEAANGFESQGLPVSMAADPAAASTTSEPR